ncbi:MAG: GAF and ANTAR domain-containing protein [Gordonia paraffinivorans]
MREIDTTDDAVTRRPSSAEPRQILDIHREIAHLALRAHGGPTTVPDEATLLRTITESAVRLIDGVDHAAVTLVRRRHRGSRAPELRSVAATSDDAERFDRLQHEYDDGPCFTAIWDHETVVITDMERETRWQDFVAAVLHRTPIRSTLSIQLYTQDIELGALTLHSERTDAFDGLTRGSCMVYATHAAIAVNNARRSDQFHSALASRDVIGQAKGMIMERFDIDAGAAFTLLQKLSQDSNTPLARVAAQLVDTDHPTSVRTGDPRREDSDP